MTTNILALPLLQATFEIATNEDWRDGIAFSGAGAAAAVAGGTNVGHGSVTGLSAAAGAVVGVYTVTFSAPTTFQLSDPNNVVIATGTCGVAFSAGGLSFTVPVGNPAWAIGDTISIQVLPAVLDITGIRFMMSVRSVTGSATVVLSGDTNAGTMTNGGTSGVLGFVFPEATITDLQPTASSTPYVLDILASADGVLRRVVVGTLSVSEGITFPAT